VWLVSGKKIRMTGTYNADRGKSLVREYGSEIGKEGGRC
jgi:hypothetical protein